MPSIVMIVGAPALAQGLLPDSRCLLPLVAPLVHATVKDNARSATNSIVRTATPRGLTFLIG